MQQSVDLPQHICLECQDIIQKAHEFKIKVQKSTSILQGKCEESIEQFGTVEDKNTQTETSAARNFRRAKAIELQRNDIIQFDDENFDSINLQSEDSIFDNQTNPLIENASNPQSVKVKSEQLGVSDDDDEYDSTENVDEDNQQTALVIIKTESCDDIVCDVSPFNEGDDSEDRGDEKYRLHKCNHCNKSFSRATHLKRHRLIHEEGKIQCSICDKRFTRIDHLNLHVASNHTESKPFQCDVADCKKGFVRQEHLKKHIEAKHSDSTKDKEICDICQKSFASKKYLRTHMKSHTIAENKGLVCKYCNREFSDKTELNEHLSKDHQNEKPYLCSGEWALKARNENDFNDFSAECGLRFVRNDYLVIHMRRHMGVKPYSECNEWKCK